MEIDSKCHSNFRFKIKIKNVRFNKISENKGGEISTEPSEILVFW